jgi:hypothetical protein
LGVESLHRSHILVSEGSSLCILAGTQAKAGAFAYEDLHNYLSLLFWFATLFMQDASL